MTLNIALHSLAEEIFRTQADKDYIVARSCYRMQLREQFLWASLQACEKYLKGTLLFNKRSARYDPVTYDESRKKNLEFGHNLTSLFKAVQTIEDLPLSQPDWLPDFLKYLTTFGNNRYLSKATYSIGDELRRLDEAVWALRRICQDFDWTPKGVNLRPILLAKASKPSSRKSPALFRPFGIDGFLEQKLKAPKSDPGRQALVWNNLFFGKRQRNSVTYMQYSSSENPPQVREWFNNPTIAEKIGFYIKF